MRAWVFQAYAHKQKHGRKAPWTVGWFDPDGKKRSRKIGSKSMAEKFARKIEGQLAAGTYEAARPKKWGEFRQEYEQKVGSGMESGTRRITNDALAHFERIVRPARMDAIKTQAIDEFVAKRRGERGKKKESTVSPATINKELRHLKAVLRIAHDWGYLPTVPKFRMLKEPKKLVTYVTPDDFAKMYGACDAARMPRGLPYPPVDWWRALLTFTYMTGWRVGEPLAVRREDVDLDAGTAITLHGDNKGRHDEMVKLHPVVVEHLRSIVSFERTLFSWPHNERALWSEFMRIQQAGGIHLPCREKHEHTPACHVYGFHDLRRAFATLNADRLTADALQALMRHKSYLTTKKYINMAKQLNVAVENLHVPNVLRRKSTG